MQIKQHIPNLLTLGNLGCGVAAIVILFNPQAVANPLTAIIILFCCALVCDFLDGFVARLLKVSSPLGKELDSLADLVTFGVFPGMLVYQMLETTLILNYPEIITEPLGNTYLTNENSPVWASFLKWSFLFIPIFSAYRLAKFNLDTRQTTGFIGLPTPANAIFFFSLYIWWNAEYMSTIAGTWRVYPPLSAPAEQTFLTPAVIIWGLAGLSVVFSLLLISPLPLMALKFKSFGLKENLFKYLLIAGAVLLVALFTYRGVPFVILLYFCLSIIETLIRPRHEVHS